MRRVSKLRLAVLVAGSMIAALLAPAAASADWSPKISIPGTGTGTSNLGSVAGANNSTFAYWTRTVGGDELVQATTINSAGVAGPILTLSAPGQDAENPVAAVAANDGDATVAWVRSNGTNDLVQSVNVSSSGTVGTVTDLSAAGNALQNAESPSIAAIDDGTVAVVWRRFNGPTWVAQAVTITPAGVPGTVRDISDTAANSLAPEVSASSTNFRIAWIKDSAELSDVFTTTLSPDGTPAQPTSLFPGGTTGYPHGLALGVDSDGSGLIAFVRASIVSHEGDPIDPNDPDSPKEIIVDGVQFGGEVATVSSAGVVLSLGMLSPLNVDVSDIQITYTKANDFIDWVETPRAVGSQSSTKYSRIVTQPTGFQTLVPGVAGNLDPSFASGAGNWSTIGYTQGTLVPGITKAFASRVTPSLARFPGADLSGASLKTANQAATTVDSFGNVTDLFYGVDLADNGFIWMSRFTDPDSSVSPQSLEYGEGLLNVNSATRSAFLFSSGSTALKVNDISLTGAGAGSYRITNEADCSGSLAPGANCEIKLAFKPITTGRVTAKVEVATQDGTTVIDLGGKGVARTRVSLNVKPKNRAQRRGKVGKVTAKLKNYGGITAKGAKICAYGNKRVVRPKKKCKKVGSIGAGRTVSRKFGFRLNGRAKKGKKYAVNFQLKANNANNRRATYRLRLKR